MLLKVSSAKKWPFSRGLCSCVLTHWPLGEVALISLITDINHYLDQCWHLIKSPLSVFSSFPPRQKLLPLTSTCPSSLGNMCQWASEDRWNQTCYHIGHRTIPDIDFRCCEFHIIFQLHIWVCVTVYSDWCGCHGNQVSGSSCFCLPHLDRVTVSCTALNSLTSGTF